MIISCPKCGFSQPKDEYCASCGVNIGTFKPKITLWKKIVSNPFVQISVVFAVVFSAILFIRQERRSELLARVEYLKGGPVMVGKNSGESRLAGSAEMAVQDSASQGAVSTAPEIPSGSSAAAATAVTSDSKVSVSANSAASIRGPKVSVKYLEVERATSEAWLTEMRSQGTVKTFDGVSVGVLPQFAAKLNAKGVKVLQTSEYSAEVGTTEWFMGTHRSDDLDSEMGLFSSLVLTEVSDGMIRGDFEMQRAFRDPADPAKSMERVSFGSPFEAPLTSAYFLTGVLPQRFASDLDESAKADTALSQIFKSRPFQTRETEFSVILEFSQAPAK